MKKEENEKFITLKFIVNGTPTVLKVNENSPLKSAVEKAIQQTGNTGRPIEDWIVKYKDKPLDISRKIKEFNFPENAEIFVSLKAGQGGGND